MIQIDQELHTRKGINPILCMSLHQNLISIHLSGYLCIYLSSPTPDHVACTTKCELDSECVAWIFNQTNNNNTCYLQNTTSGNVYSYGTTSGVKGKPFPPLPIFIHMFLCCIHFNCTSSSPIRISIYLPLGSWRLDYSQISDTTMLSHHRPGAYPFR